MKNLLENTIGCHLMIWETDVKKRNINNQIKFLVSVQTEVNIGDTIVTKYSAEEIHSYEIMNIIDRRKSTLNKYDYLIAESKFKNASLLIGTFNLDGVSLRFKNFFNIKD